MNLFKLKMFCTLIVLGVFLKTAAAQTVKTTGGVNLLSDTPKVFLLDGFDNNDQIEFTIAGKTSKICQKPEQFKGSVDEVQKEISLDLEVIEYRCENFSESTRHQVPFSGRVILPAPLSSGTYNVFLGGIRQGIIKIKNVLPALADSVNITSKKGVHTIKLSGYHPNKCWNFDKVKMIEQDDILVLLPLRIRRSKCNGKLNWETTLPLPDHYEHILNKNDQPVLIHVRTRKYSAPYTLNQVIFPSLK